MKNFWPDNPAIATLRQLGMLDSVLYVCSRFASIFSPAIRFHSYIFHRLEVPPTPLVAERVIARYDTVLLNSPDEVLLDFPRAAAVFEARFEQGGTCIVLIDRGHAIGFIWLQPTVYVEDEVECEYHLNDLAAWDYDIYIVPEKRFGRGFAILWELAFAYLREGRIESCYSRVSSFNLPSITSHERLGAVRVGRAVFCTIGPLQFACLTLPPYFNVSLRRKTEARF